MPIALGYSLADQDFTRTKSIGIWNVSTRLVRQLAEHPAVAQLTVFVNSTQTGLIRSDKVQARLYGLASRGKLGRLIWDQWWVYRAARQAGHPWLFLPKGFASFVRPCPVRLAAYVHDAIHDFYARTYRPNPLGRETGYFLRCLKATLRQATVVFTNSHFTATEIRRLASEWGVPVPRLCPAGIGFDPPPMGAAPRSRLVVFAGLLPHKCTPMAVEFLSRWTAERAGSVEVDWVGSLPSGVRLPDRAGWRQQTRLSANEYDRLLRGAGVVVYFSAYEGFGMPPVEGLLAGAAPVYSAIPAMLESMGGTGFAFTNGSYESFAQAMNQAIQAPPSLLAAWRQQLIDRHSWPEVADRIVQELMQAKATP